MHIPLSQTADSTVLDFDDALYEYEHMKNPGFESNKWLYVPCRYDEYRYILGTRGNNPIVCIGINPSTAEPGNLDNTLKSVNRHALSGGYDSFVMFNVYAQRATNPDDMDILPNLRLHRENMKAFDFTLKTLGARAIWAAWGTIIEKRSYLSELLCDMAIIADKYGATWYTVGPISKKGHPHHPLYLSNSSTFSKFNMQAYLENILKRSK